MEMHAVEAMPTAITSRSHGECGEMLSNSAKTNCEWNYDALAAEAAIEPVYQDLLKSMDAADRERKARSPHFQDGHPSFREALIASQTSWIKFRDAQCQIEMFEWRGGTSERQRYEMCAVRMNGDRLAQLQEMQRKY